MNWYMVTKFATVWLFFFTTVKLIDSDGNCLQVLSPKQCYDIQEAGSGLARGVHHTSGVIQHLVLRCISESKDILKSSFDLLKEELQKVKDSSDSGSCPQDHPYAYWNGQYCCTYNKEKVGRHPCNGNIIKLSSTCCLNNAYIKCPSKKCSNHRAVGASKSWTSVCPDHHPYAYYDGSYCCTHDKEKSYKGGGTKCDGGEISLTSRCCYGNHFVKCPNGKCLNHPKTGKSTTWDSFCPRSHPYVYLSGKYCCAHNEEKVGSGSTCDGSLIDFSSACCLNDDYVKCASGDMCSSHWSLVASAEAGLIFAAEACISSTNGQLTKANVDIVKITEQIFKTLIKDGRAVDSLFGTIAYHYVEGNEFTTHRHNVEEVVEQYIPKIKKVLYEMEIHIKSKAKNIFDEFSHSLQTIIGGAADIDFDKSRAKVEETITEASTNYISTYISMIQKIIQETFNHMEVIDSSTNKIKDNQKLKLALESARSLVGEALEDTRRATNDETIVKQLKNFCSWITEDYKEIKNTFGEIRAIREKSK